jgi:hypothetical protein
LYFNIPKGSLSVGSLFFEGWKNSPYFKMARADNQKHKPGAKSYFFSIEYSEGFSTIFEAGIHIYFFN